MVHRGNQKMADRRGCVGFRRMSRRRSLQVGICGALGVSLADILRIEGRADDQAFSSTQSKARLNAKALSVIQLHLGGGWPQLFSRNLANRIWAQLMGRGVIEPVDDIRASNPPVNGPLLNALSARLVESKFDLRTLVRDICNSQVYQLSAKPNDSNRRDTRQFSHSHLKRLRADVLIDSLVTATGVPRGFPGFPEGTRAIEYYPRESGETEGPHFGDVFFATFGRSSRGTVCACETKKEPTLSQTLHLSVGETVRDRISKNREVVKLLESHASADAILEQLFVRTLCRRPSDTERESLKSIIADASDPLVAYEDIFWSLLNSTEFIFNH